MRRTRLLLGIGLACALAGGQVWSAGPGPCPTPNTYIQPNYPPGGYIPPGCQTPTPPKEPGKGPEAPPPEQPTLPTDAFAQAPEAGTQGGESFNPSMFGDLLGPYTTVSLGGRRGSTVNARVFVSPVASRGAFKIADNESPRPVDRVFISYNYFNNVLGPLAGPGIPQTNLNREIVGFEKTLLNGNASFGMRLPFIQITGFDQIADSFVGDLTFVSKYAFVNNLETMNVLSGGLVVTAPTGQFNILFGPVHSTLIQPWAGFIYNMGGVYAHGFSSIMVPTDSRDVTLWFNDIGVGWFAYRNNCRSSLISAIVPTGEVHVNTPLNHRELSSTDPFFIDSVNLTGGVYWVFNQRVFLGTGVGFPVAGPKPFDVEAICNMNFRF